MKKISPIINKNPLENQKLQQFEFDAPSQYYHYNQKKDKTAQKVEPTQSTVSNVDVNNDLSHNNDVNIENEATKAPSNKHRQFVDRHNSVVQQIKQQNNLK
ncbi:MAG: hypothetical protein RR123_03920 [Clostridia bacterium]